MANQMTQKYLQGEIIAPDKDGWASFANTLIMISNVNSLKVDGSGGLINGYGSAWWKCKSCQRPSILNFSSCKSLNVINLNLINSPKSHIHIHGCSDATFTGLNISSPETSPNTDGFDISYSQNVLIENSIIATGDDCVAISGGSSHVNVTGISCGPGHGISIGSLGKKYDTVENVYVSNINFTRTTNGVRIKTIQNGVGYAKQITFQDITFEETRFPIIIDQHYTSYDDSLGNGRSVEVSGITYRDFKGTSADGRAIYLNCADSGCFDLTLDDINLVSNYPGKPATCFCNNAHGTVTSTTPNCSGLLTA
ncbi:hypothetical protein VNO78_26277 [Psophocarpus tetragonolobus]|uniref:Polygalacturonase n=1 Tax=Psophocarpus tetragonolobus TaxID=3891 RepID=A0AAN9X8T2_PSOTE